MNKYVRIALTIVLSILYNNSYAIFGAGDVVYDPANVAQTINVVKAAQSQLDRLGSLLGISTNQLDTLTNLTKSFGDSSNLNRINHILTPKDLSDILNTNPAYHNYNLNTLVDINGILDAFLGISFDGWIEAIENPLNFYSASLINPAISRIGASTGIPNPTIAYTQWYATQTINDKANLNLKMQNDITDLMNTDWFSESKTRKINLQELATRSKYAENNSANATTLTDQQRSQGQLGSINNEILIETAAQTVAAQEAVLRTTALENKNLQQIINSERNIAEIELNLDN